MYQVKGYLPEDVQGNRKHVTLIAEKASGCIEAIASAAEAEGMSDVTSVSLSRIKEYFVASNEDDGKFFVATVADIVVVKKTVKRITYQWLIRAKDIDEANSFAKKQIEQGYDMLLVGIKEEKIFSVI